MTRAADQDGQRGCEGAAQVQSGTPVRLMDSERIQLKAIATFSGCGGATEGMVRAGLDVRLAVDGWDVACVAHRRWHPRMPTLMAMVEDVAGLGVTADFVWASPSCKPWSTANRSAKRGKDHPEYYSLARLVSDAFEAHRARWLVIENVGGLLWSKEGRIEVGEFRAACESRRLRYTINVVNSNTLGIAQVRRRAFLIVGPSHVRIGHGSDFIPPEGVEEPLLQRARARARAPSQRAGAAVLIDDLPNKWSDAYRFGHRAVSAVDASPGSRHQKRTTEWIEAQRTVKARDDSGLLPDERRRAGASVLTEELHYKWRSGAEYARASRGVSAGEHDGHTSTDPKTREVTFTGRTLAECAALQHVPMSILRGFTKRDAHALVGNAVPPPVAEHVCRHVIAADENLNRGAA